MPALALTMGDPAGVGVEITIDVWCHRHTNGCPAFAFYGSKELVTARATALNRPVPVAPVSSPAEATGVFDTALPVVVRDDFTPKTGVAVVPGQPSATYAGAVIASIRHATEDVVAHRADALVTNPIAKHVVQAAGFAHPGHTEFLGSLALELTGGGPFTPVMLLAAHELRVVPLTVHIPILEVPRAITGALIDTTTRILAGSLVQDFGISSPRIVIAGLNPHAGENGTIGTEDRDVIAPAVAALVKSGLDVRGPLSADTLFHAEARSRYDAVLAMYHDQALIPIKTLAFDRGVNATLGLPFVRTSPDHGTAFDIAGRGQASSRSLLEALKLAKQMAQHRSIRSAAPPAAGAE